jgi:mannitol-1-phosphate 5-dehydrogenase
MTRTFVGFGFGPIQSGLFLYEAYLSGNFDRFVVAEVDEDLVRAVRDAGGRYALNIARADRVDPFELSGIELMNPRSEEGQKGLVDAIADAQELATALPSVDFYDAGGETSVVSLLTAGLEKHHGPQPTILYAAENNNHAAEILTDRLRAAGAGLEQFQALNTVIGKMSGVITDPETIAAMELACITPRSGRAILIEEFNRILVSRVELADFRRGIEVFEEKPDLLPFEEAKLYGHNAIHAVMGYLADLRGYRTISQVVGDEEILTVARRAFLDESGPALIARHAGLGDPLFTPAGWREYAEDLLERMVNPNLNDLVERVGRDHVRKLGWDDRIYGTMRRALDAGLSPTCLAQGAAAGVRSMVGRANELTSPPSALPSDEAELTRQRLAELLGEVWGAEIDPVQASQLIDLTHLAMDQLPAGRTG